MAELAASVPNLLTEDWNGLNVLHQSASMVGALELGLSSCPGSELADKSLEGKKFPDHLEVLGGSRHANIHHTIASSSPSRLTPCAEIAP